MLTTTRYIIIIALNLCSVLLVNGQTKVITTTYTYDGKKYPLQMEVTDWKAVFNQNKTTTYTPASSTSTTSIYYRMPGSMRRLHKQMQKLDQSMKQAADKKQFINNQLDVVYSLYEEGDYESALSILRTKEVMEGKYLNDRYPMLYFLAAAKTGQASAAFSNYAVTFCYSDRDAAGKAIPGTYKSYIVDDPGSTTARRVQDKFTEKQQMQVELAFSEVLLQKDKSEYYKTAFGTETALTHLDKSVAYFGKKGFTPEADPSVILLYELAGDPEKSQQLFSGIINAPKATNSTKYQLCKYIINKAEPGSNLLKAAMDKMKLLAENATTEDEKILTKLELVKGYYALGDNSTAITHALDLSTRLPKESADYCAVVLLFGKIERSEKHYKTALGHYEYPIFFSKDANLKREAFAEKAMCFVDSGDVKNAVLTYQQYYKDMPDKFTANECAAFYIDHNEYVLAETILDQALKLDPLFYITQLNYGDLLVATGKPKKARPYYVAAHNMSGELSDAQLKVIEDYK